MPTHNDFMKLALEEAKVAAAEGEIPIGAVLTSGERILASDHNRRERTNDPTAHAEILAIRRACFATGDWRLEDSTLYVTLEPCPMCASAMVLARLFRVVFGAPDMKAGACGSVYNIAQDGNLNHKLEVIGGVMEDECESLLRDFFNRLR